MTFFEDDRTRAQDQATAEAFADPRPGDRFQEMYSWWMIVVSAGPEGVKVMNGHGPTNVVRGRFPDGEIVEPFAERAEVRWYATAEDFRDAWRYGGRVTGYSMMLCDRGKVDVTGWLERAKSAPDEPTHPARAAEPAAAEREGRAPKPPAITLLEEALFLRQNGEYAPGGNENWHDWDDRAERFLRSLLPPEAP